VEKFRGAIGIKHCQEGGRIKKIASKKAGKGRSRIGILNRIQDNRERGKRKGVGNHGI